MAWVQKTVHDTFYNDPAINNGLGLGIVLNFVGKWSNGTSFNNIIGPASGSTSGPIVVTASPSNVTVNTPAAVVTGQTIQNQIPTSSLSKIIPPMCSDSISSSNQLKIEKFISNNSLFIILLFLLFLFLIYIYYCY